MKQNAIRPHYHGQLSKKFWRAVNSLPEPHNSELYLAGVILQEIEHKVLFLLKEHAKTNDT